MSATSPRAITRGADTPRSVQVATQVSIWPVRARMRSCIAQAWQWVKPRRAGEDASRPPVSVLPAAATGILAPAQGDTLGGWDGEWPTMKRRNLLLVATVLGEPATIVNNGAIAGRIVSLIA